MSLGAVDLNLLLPLKALLEEANVTRAGDRLELSQPAMSAALARLRRHFHDDLLVMRGRSFELTPFARDLLPDVRTAVSLITVALGLEESFEPATSTRAFSLAMSDYAIAVLHDPLVRLVQQQAPEVRLQIAHLGPDVRADDRVLVDHDVVIAPAGLGFPGKSQPMWRDRMVTIVDRHNPCVVDGRLDAAALAVLPHAVGSFGPGALTPVDRVVAELHIERRVVLEVYGFLPLLFVVEGTDMVAAVPELLARAYLRGDSAVQVVDSPLGESAVLAENFWFGEDRLASSAHRWLFDQLATAAATLAGRAGAVTARAHGGGGPSIRGA